MTTCVPQAIPRQTCGVVSMHISTSQDPHTVMQMYYSFTYKSKIATSVVL